MDAVKGVFRRATQVTREKMGNADTSADNDLNEVIRRIKLMERSCCTISEKVQKLAKAIEDVGLLTKDIAEEYKTMSTNLTQTPVSNEPPPPQEMVHLSNELSAFGSELAAKAQELGRDLKSNAFDNLSAFVREIPSLRTMEEDRKKKQLEYDFFKTKVAALIKQPPKDHSRIPRNEGILENWRQALHTANENMKQASSNLWSNGCRSIDMSVYTVSMTLGNYFGYGLNSAKNHFSSVRLPSYPTAPLLPPTALPPPPPSWVPPPTANPYAQPQSNPSQQQFGGQSPQQQQNSFGQQSPQQQPQQQQGQQGFSPNGYPSPQNQNHNQSQFGATSPQQSQQWQQSSQPPQQQQQQPQQWQHQQQQQAQSPQQQHQAQSPQQQQQSQQQQQQQQSQQWQQPQQWQQSTQQQQHEHQQPQQQSQQQPQPQQQQNGWGAAPQPHDAGPPPPPAPSGDSHFTPAPENQGNIPSSWAEQGNQQGGTGDQPPPPPQ